jgi:hypothetical protein
VKADSVDRTQANLAPEEEAVLEQAGWKKGEPIPDLRGTKLGRRLEEERNKLRGASEQLDGMTPVPPDTPPIVIPTPKDINTLPPEQQAEIRQSMSEMEEVKQRIDASRAVAQHEAAVTAPEGVAGVPGMADAWATAVQAQGAAPMGVVIENDLSEDGTPPSVVDPQQQQPQPGSASDHPAVAAPAAETAAEEEVKTHCPKCGHDLASEPCVPTDTDIQVYTQAVLGGKRFRKDYSLFGGQMAVGFRALTPMEGELAQQTAAVDASDTMYAFTVRHMEYRMTMSIERIQRAGQEQPITVKPLLDACTPEEGPQRLRELRNWMNQKVHVTEEGRQAVADAFTDFAGICNYLQERARDPDFFANAVTHGS